MDNAQRISELKQELNAAQALWDKLNAKRDYSVAGQAEYEAAFAALRRAKAALTQATDANLTKANLT